MINNIKIVKEENGNTSFIKNPSNLIDAFLPPVAGIRVNNKSNDDDAIIEIFSITGQKYTFLVSSIESTQIKPALAVPFSGTAEDLATLLRDSFFFEVDTVDWGNITGTLSNQTDLQNALDAINGSLSSEFSDDQTMIADAINVNQDDYTPTQISKNWQTTQLLYLNPTLNVDITGLTAPTGNGRAIKYLMNNASNRDIKLKNNSNNSLPANRFLFEKDLIIKDRQGLVIVYNPIELRWNAVTLK